MDLSASEFLDCVKRNEKISNVSGRLISYAGLRYYQSTTDGERTKFLSDIQEKVNHNAPFLSGGKIFFWQAKSGQMCP